MKKRSYTHTISLFTHMDEQDPFFFETQALQSGYQYIAGLDEAGRGPLAGPVVAAAVILPPDYNLPTLTDSKKLSPRQRELLFPKIQQQAVSLGVGMMNASVIDRINILEATRLAMKQALAKLDPRPDYILVDALSIDSDIPQQAIVKGDLRSHSIAAASVIAKVTRDRMMAEYHQTYPDYNFLQHKGYGTREHLNRIRTYGPSPLHRRTFRGVREHVVNREPNGAGEYE
jgi:ribonuclease HII